MFIIFAIFNALWVPLVYAFFPETKGLELEDVDHIFDKGGITGGVWSSPGGRTVERKRIDQKQKKYKKMTVNRSDGFRTTLPPKTEQPSS